MSFFELDGGAKKKAKKSTKAKATKKTPAKKTPAKKSTSGKKKSKKGGNFLGTVSELFAPAGWENFVTAAGLLALDRTDNYLRKSKDSKKQHGGVDDTPKMEEEMTGGARKRSSSRKQRGGSDGHHTIEALDAMISGEEQEMTSQTGGAKSKSRSRSSSRSKPKVKKTVKKVRNHKGGAMSEEQQNALYEAYSKNKNSQNKNSQNATIYDSFIANLLTQLGVEVNDTNVEEAKLVIDYKKKPNGNQSKVNAKNRLNAFISSQTSPLAQNQNSLFGNSLREANTEPIPIPGTSGLPNTRLGSNTGTYPNYSSPTSNATSNASLQFGPMSPNAPQSGGGKPKSKSKSSSKKPKAKKPKTKAKKPTKGRK
jgi:hypothetical protein